MQAWFVAIVAVAYVTLLFGIASHGDRRAAGRASGLTRPNIYALSLGIYCTSWTFFGSVGLAAERADGYRSPFSAASAGLLRRVLIEHGTAYVNLNDPRALLDGATSSCGAAEFQTQVERTLRQFPTVRRVILAIDGEPRRFYEWMGQDCDLSNDQCDAGPLRQGR